MTSLLRKLLKFLGFKNCIKFSDKEFDELIPIEVTRMIEAYLYGENNYFTQIAMSEFVLMNYKNPVLEKIKNHIMLIHEKNKTLEELNGWLTFSGKMELKQLAENLQSMGSESDESPRKI